MTGTGAPDPEAVIDAMYAAIFAGDAEGALRHCTDDAEWHSVTPSPQSGSTSARAYVEMLLRFLADHPGYRILEHDRRAWGDIVVTYLRTSLGRGTMTFRLVGDRVAEIWAINAEGRDATDFF